MSTRQILAGPSVRSSLSRRRSGAAKPGVYVTLNPVIPALLERNRENHKP